MHGKQVNNQQMKSTLGKDVQKLQKRIMQHSEKVEGELVHDIRVICKRVRAELLLLKSKSKQSKLKKISKELAGSLSSIRDAEVMLETYDSLFPDQSNDSVIELRRRLESELGKRQVDSERLLANIKLLRAALKAGAFAKEDGFGSSKSIDDAKEKSRAKYRKLNSTDRETYHEWRKAVKAYLYLLRLDRNVKRAELVEVKGLAEELGLLHDLHVFDDLVSQHHPEYSDLVQKPVLNRERELLNEVHRLATRIYEIGGDVFQND